MTSTPLADPIDHLIVLEIARIFGCIRIDNGYRTDFGTDVLTDEDLSFPEKKSCIEVFDDTEKTEKQSVSYRTGTLHIRADLSIFLSPDPELAPKNPRATARKALADMRRALQVEPRQMPKGVGDISISARNIQGRESGSNYLVASLELTVTFTETY